MSQPAGQAASQAASTPSERVMLAAGASAADLRALAARQGWTPTGDHPRGHLCYRQLQWSTAQGHRVVWIEFHDFGVCQLVVLPGTSDAAGDGTGDGSGDGAGAVVALLRAELDLVDAERLLDDLSTTDDPWTLLRGLPLLAMLPLPVDEARCLRAFARALAHPTRTIRRAAITPLLVRGGGDEPWPGVRTLLRERLAHETDLADRLRRGLEILDNQPGVVCTY